VARKIAYVIVFALGLVLASCGAPAPDDGAVARAVEATLTARVPTSVAEPVELGTRLPQATSTPLATLELAPTATVVPAQAEAPDLVEAQVLEVVDGDTIKVSIDGQVYSLRYIGMDSPETKDPNQPVQPFGEEATQKNQELVGGKTVRLEKDVSETDRYGRLLRYVWVGDLMINAEMVRQGYAQVATYPPDVKYQELFLKLQQEARDAGRGLWGQSSASAKQNANLRAGPGTNYPLAGGVKAGQSLDVVAKNEAGDWLQLANGVWIASFLVANPPPIPVASAIPPAPVPTSRPAPTSPPAVRAPSQPVGNCHPCYPDVCIPPPPPDLDCPETPYCQFRVICDPHRFDGDHDGIGCEVCR
jgi:micrococcal nuclease